MTHGKNAEELNSEDDSSCSSIDDEDAELLTEEVQERFFKVLSGLKKKDPKLYEENVKYFSAEDSEQNSTKDENKKKKKRLEKDYKEWLKGQKDKVKDDEVQKDLEGLQDFWANPNISKEDQFLRDYILNKKFLERDEKFSGEKELEKLVDEEKELEEQVQFEEKYNTRFENPDEEFFKKYPHTMKKAFDKLEIKQKSKTKQHELNGDDKMNEDSKKKKRKNKSKRRNSSLSETQKKESTTEENDNTKLTRKRTPSLSKGVTDIKIEKEITAVDGEPKKNNESRKQKNKFKRKAHSISETEKGVKRGKVVENIKIEIAYQTASKDNPLNKKFTKDKLFLKKEKLIKQKLKEQKKTKSKTNSEIGKSTKEKNTAVNNGNKAIMIRGIKKEPTKKIRKLRHRKIKKILKDEDINCDVLKIMKKIKSESPKMEKSINMWKNIIKNKIGMHKTTP